MPSTAQPTDFFRYLLPTAAAQPWGVAVTGGGRFRAEARIPYPPAVHPADHAFTWAQGRVLGALQIVWIAEGAGEFESRETGRVDLVAGMGLRLLPGVWHRYRPRPETGWTEKWIEMVGVVPDALRQAGVWGSGCAVVRPARPETCAVEIDAMHELIMNAVDGQEGQLAARALSLLAALQRSPADHPRVGPKPVELAVDQARRWMEDDPVAVGPMPEVARRLGVGYTHFRREFRRRTGVSPQQYQLRLRMQRAQRLLGSTGQSIKQIADRLEFSSPYHLSAAFKAHFGVSPREWRRQQD